MPTRYVAHRGGAAQWPENSLTAFRNAIALGARVLELDVHLTADGVVAVIHDPTLDREVALKLLHAEALDSAAARDRFLREARALSHLNHAHICTIYEIGEDDGRLFIVMELLGVRTSAVS